MPVDYRKTILPSGLTVLSERMLDRRSIAVGVWLRNGARDEPADWLGISHFIEHMMFKGTERRDARGIAGSLESLGGHLDAFTGREQVCYYARALSEHLPDAVDVLADIVCRSRFAEPEVTREKSVVREEIFSCEDNPEDKVSELLNELVWGDHPLGRPILGTVSTIDRLDSETLRRYFRSRYRPEHLVLAAAGGLDHDRFVELVEAQFRAPGGEALPLSGGPPAFRPSVRHVTRDDLQQVYLSLGTRGSPYGDPDRFPLAVLSTLIGGGMSSRLFQSVREDLGLAYSIYSAVEFNRDCGMHSIHLGVAPEHVREALARVRVELETLRREGPSEDEVASARSQLRGSILMGDESVSNHMHHMAQEELYGREFTSADAQVAEVETVTRDRVVEMCERYLDPRTYALAVLGPAGEAKGDEAEWEV